MSTKKKNLLLMSAQKVDLEFATKVAEQCDLHLISVVDPVEGIHLLDQDGASLVFADCTNESQYQALEQAIQDRMGLFSDKINPNLFHFLVPNERNLAKLRYTFESPILGNLVFRDESTLTELIDRYSKVCAALLGKKTFELSAFVGDSAETQSVQIEAPKQKPDVLQGVKDFMLRVGYHPRLASLATSAADELLFNAFYEAPVDEFGKTVGKTMFRGGTSVRSLFKPVTLQLAFDGKSTGIGVIDEYGSLNKSKLLAGIMSLFPDDRRKGRAVPIGQAIGLSLQLRQGASLGFLCDPGNRTLSMAFFPLQKKFVDFRKSFRFVVTQFYLK